MLLPLLFFLLLSFDVSAEKDHALPRLNDTKAAEAFIDSAEVVVVGFLEGEQSRGYKKLAAAAQRVKTVPVAMCTVKEVWVDLNVTSESISLFRKADNFRENLILTQTKKLETDGLINFFVINEIRYITEYNQVRAVGLFNSEVKTHLLLFANEGSKEYTELRDRLRDLAPEFTGKVKSNSQSLEYFGLKSADLPRVGIYDGNSDMKWLLPEGEISTERVRDFCQSFIRGELKEVQQAGKTARTEL